MSTYSLLISPHILSQWSQFHTIILQPIPAQLSRPLTTPLCDVMHHSVPHSIFISAYIQYIYFSFFSSALPSSCPVQSPPQQYPTVFIQQPVPSLISTTGPTHFRVPLTTGPSHHYTITTSVSAPELGFYQRHLNYVYGDTASKPFCAQIKSLLICMSYCCVSPDLNFLSIAKMTKQ